MQKRTREIIALVLLLVLGVGVALAMGWYILVGHNWNVAASNIDDSLGQMDGYTVFLVQGTRPLERDAADAAPDLSANQETLSGADTKSLGIQGEGAIASENNAASSQVGAEQPDLTSSSEMQSQNADAVAPISEASTQDAASTAASQPAAPTAEELNYALSKLVANYREKGAEVVIVRDWLEDSYALPRTMRIGSQDISVFEVDYPARPAAVRTQAKLLQRRGSDLNVLVTNDPAIEDTYFGNVGIMVSTAHDDDYESGRYSGNSFCVDVPHIGQVEAVIVSPSGVISSKTLDLPLDE